MPRKKIIWLLKVVITLLILLVLINTIKTDAIVQALRNADKSYMLMAMLLMPLNIGLQVVKWKVLLTTLEQKISWADAGSSVLVGMALGLVTPGRIGEFARAFAIKSGDNLRVLGLAAIDKLCNLAWTVLLGAGAILALPRMLFQQNILMIVFGIILYAVGVFIIVFLAFNPGFIRGILYSISLMLPKRQKIKGLISSFDGLTRRKALAVFLLSLLFYVTFILQFFFLVNAFSDISLWNGFRGLPAIIFAKTFLPISIGGLGVGELASVRFLGIFGVVDAAAFNASLILFTLNVALPGIAGLFFIPKLRFSGSEQ